MSLEPQLQTGVLPDAEEVCYGDQRCATGVMA
jgi:hypothetical protein